MAAKRRLVREPAGSLKFKIVTVSPSSSDHLRDNTQPPSKQQLGGGFSFGSGSSTDSDEYGSTATSRRQLLVKLRVNPERKERLQQKMTENKTSFIRSITENEEEVKKPLLVKLRVTPEYKERLQQQQQKIKEKKRSAEKDERKRRLLDCDAEAAQAQLLLLLGQQQQQQQEEEEMMRFYCDYYGYHCHQHQIKMMSRRGCGGNYYFPPALSSNMC